MRKLVRSTLWAIGFTAGKKSERARTIQILNEWLDSGGGDPSQTLERIKRG